VPFGWNYAVFYINGAEGRFDNNDGRYWEILACGEDGTPTEGAVNNQALSYDSGRITPVIQFQPDPARAARILEEDLRRHPERLRHFGNLWGFKTEAENESDAAYQKVAGEIERFAAAHSGDAAALEIAFKFVMYNRKHLPAALYDKLFAAVVATNPTSALAGDAMYQQVLAEKDPQKKIAAARAFLEKFPSHKSVPNAYAAIFWAQYKNLSDLGGAENTFREFVKIYPDIADPYVMMARFYVEQKTKLDEAVKLLTRAAELCRSDQPPLKPRPGSAFQILVACWVPPPELREFGLPRLEKDQATIRYWRGQARLLLDDAAGAAEDLASAARVLVDDPKAALALGHAYEKLGKKEAALAAYLDAATAPIQTTRDPEDALEKFFVGGMGSREELDARLAVRMGERRKKMAADYKPRRIDRPAPAFEYTALDGKKINGAALRGQPVVINFWSTWCAPCLLEMPGFVEFQKRNPGVRVLAVEFDSSPEQIKALLERRKLTTLNVAMLGGGTIFSQSGLPQTYVLDAEGRIQFAHQGMLPDVVAILEKDLALLGAAREH
jgi:thiol-disulfide isomerase/thioredoxin/tetratricopeptide (TPR) repeat protein